jgi:hypothetical protein
LECGLVLLLQCRRAVLVGEQLLLTVGWLKLRQQLLLGHSRRSACGFVVQVVFWQQQQQQRRLSKPRHSAAADL